MPDTDALNRALAEKVAEVEGWEFEGGFGPNYCADLNAVHNALLALGLTWSHVGAEDVAVWCMGAGGVTHVAPADRPPAALATALVLAALGVLEGRETVTEEELAAIEETYRGPEWKLGTDDRVIGLVGEVRRLRRLESWVRGMVDFERAVEVPADDAQMLAIHTDRRILLREMVRLLDEKEEAPDA